MVDNDSEYDAEWDGTLFTAAIPVVKVSTSTDDEDWEARYNEDTTGYVPDPATTSFTDLDLEPALVELRKTAAWIDLDEWHDS